MNRRQLSLLGIIVLLLPLVGGVLAGSGVAIEPSAAQPAWSSPTVKVLKRVSTQIGAQHEPNYFSNLDCSLIDYRMVSGIVGGSTMQTGCFTDTAYGLFDSDHATIIFGGTDEALPLLAYAPGQSLVPWPKALNLVSLSNVSTGGALLSVYRNPLKAMTDVRNSLGQLTAKKLTAPADLLIRDSGGQPLVLNPQTLAFSDNGSYCWYYPCH